MKRGFSGMDTFYVADSDSSFLKKIAHDSKATNDYNKQFGGFATSCKEMNAIKKEETIKEVVGGINFSSRLNEIREFATNDQLQIMVINIDAFRKSFENEKDESKNVNIIHRYNDKLGYTPLQLIQDTKPVVIVDEPQTTLSTALAKKSVQNLKPLVMLRYSATHKEKVNLMYKLDAVDAYNKQLVKQIEITSVKVDFAAIDGAYLKLISVKNNPAIRVKVELDILD